LVNYENYQLLVYFHIMLHQPKACLCELSYMHGLVMLWTLKYMCQNNSYISWVLLMFTLLLKMWGVDYVPPKLNQAVSETVLLSSTNLFTLELTKNSNSSIRNFFSWLFIRVWQRCNGSHSYQQNLTHYSLFMVYHIFIQNYWALSMCI
jgi:hypothetical protein